MGREIVVRFLAELDKCCVIQTYVIVCKLYVLIHDLEDNYGTG